MTRVYQIDTVPTWYNGYTTAAFFLTMLLTGPLFAALLLKLAKVPFNGKFFAALSVLALLASLAWWFYRPTIWVSSTVPYSRRMRCCQTGHMAGWALYSTGCRIRLLDLPAAAPGSTYGARTDHRSDSDDSGRIDRPRAVLWPAYDRRHGDCRVIYRRGTGPRLFKELQ